VKTRIFWTSYEVKVIADAIVKALIKDHSFDKLEVAFSNATPYKHINKQVLTVVRAEQLGFPESRRRVLNSFLNLNSLLPEIRYALEKQRPKIEADAEILGSASEKTAPANSAEVPTEKVERLVADVVSDFISELVDVLVDRVAKRMLELSPPVLVSNTPVTEETCAQKSLHIPYHN